VPAVGWLRHYRRAWLGGDLVAALTTWALVVPQAIAYAQIAGLPPQAGLFAAFAGLLGYGLFGTCRQLIVSPTSSTAAISAAIVAPVALGDPERFAAASAAWPCSSGWC
jgi:MFS superfamily sulfate permease-like transporter